jgi:hypothetical protein
VKIFPDGAPEWIRRKREIPVNCLKDESIIYKYYDYIVLG